MSRWSGFKGVSPFARPFPRLTKEAMGKGIARYTFSRTQRRRSQPVTAPGGENDCNWYLVPMAAISGETGCCIWHLEPAARRQTVTRSPALPP